MAFQLKAGKEYEFQFRPTVNPKRRICSINQSVQFDAEGNKVFAVNSMLGTYDEADWGQKLEEINLPTVIVPYNLGVVDLKDVYTAIEDLDLPELYDWESDEV